MIPAFVTQPAELAASPSLILASLASSLAGPRVSRNTLLYLAGRASAVDIASGENTTSQAHEPSTVSNRPINAADLPEDAAQHARQGFDPQAGSLPLPETGLAGGRPLVAPPLAADVPAALLPPRLPFEAPTPFASATLRHEALQDETDLLQEDLDHLADKIKLILDEDARRHGIHV